MRNFRERSVAIIRREMKRDEEEKKKREGRDKQRKSRNRKRSEYKDK